MIQPRKPSPAQAAIVSMSGFIRDCSRPSDACFSAVQKAKYTRPMPMTPVTIGPMLVSCAIDSGSSMPRIRAASSATLLSGAASRRYITSKNTMTAETPRKVHKIPISTWKIQSSIRRRGPHGPSYGLSLPGSAIAPDGTFDRAGNQDLLR